MHSPVSMSDLSVRCLCENINADKQTCPSGIWLNQVNLTQPHSPIKGYFGQMSGGGLRVLVKCLRVCAFSVKHKEIVVQDDTADLFYTLSQQHGSVWVSRQIRIMLCIFSQLTECHSSQQPPFDVPLFKNNSFAHLFSLCMTPSQSFSLFTIFSFTFCPSLCPPHHAFILAWPCFEEYMLFLSIKTQHGFFYGRLQEIHMKIDMYFAYCWQLHFERGYFY